MKRAVLCFLLLLPAIASGADLSAPEILQRTAQTYRALRSYDIRINVQTIRNGNVSVRQLKQVQSAPGKYLVEEAGAFVRVAAGATEWEFHPATNEYRKAAADSHAPTCITALEQIDQGVQNTAIARQEQFAVKGKPVPVYVVRAMRRVWPTDGPGDSDFAAARADQASLLMTQYWIDQRSFLVYKVVKYSQVATQITLYSIAKWNQPVAESPAFKPPANARSVTEFSTAAAKSKPIIGSEAPDFTLPNTASRQVNLREFRGKVLIVDFWATWCPPCRELMPHLEKMHREFADKGLVVLGLDVGEDGPTVDKFAKEMGYTFQLLLGAEPDISAKYSVEGYPTTFVIDRQGKIVLRESGGGSADALRAAVEKALSAGKQ